MELRNPRAERNCTPEEVLGCRRVDVVDGAPPTLAGVLDFGEIDHDIVDSRLDSPDPAALYGGQAAAQTLLAADRTAADGPGPHLLHCHFLGRAVTRHGRRSSGWTGTATVAASAPAPWWPCRAAGR